MTRTRIIWLVFLWVLFVELSIHGMPLGYDETWNYNETAALGPIYTLTHYAFNNHVLYAFFMSLLPGTLVRLDPFLMRVPNWLACLGLFALISLSFASALRSRNANARTDAAIHFALTTSAVFASAQLVYYYLEGRGYLLGCTMALAAIYARQPRFRDWISDVSLSLSAYAVFTFAYTWPGLLAVDLVEGGASAAGVRRVLRRWSRSTLLLVLLHAFSLARMRDESRGYQEFTERFAYTQTLLHATFDVPSLSAFMVLGALALAIVTYLVTTWPRVPVRANAGRAPVVMAAYLSSAVVSFFLVAEATNILHIVQPPYVRNGMFVSLFAVMALGLTASAWLRQDSFTLVARTAAFAMFAVIAVNGVATARAVFPPLLAGKPQRFPVANVDCPVPINNTFLRSLPKGTDIFCQGYAGSVCWPFGYNIARFGLHTLPGGGDAFDREPRINQCWIGTEAPDRSCTLYLRAAKGDPFQPLCY
jgi:hypothetical protein